MNANNALPFVDCAFACTFACAFACAVALSILVMIIYMIYLRLPDKGQKYSAATVRRLDRHGILVIQVRVAAMIYYNALPAKTAHASSSVKLEQYLAALIQLEAALL